MENNMAMEYPMFCYQCEQTAGGKGKYIFLYIKGNILYRK